MEEQKKIRVACYCRISTKIDEQQTSLESQKIYYEEFIKQNKNWEFSGLYADKFTGTKLIRPEFTKMLTKCGVEIVDDGEFLGVKDLKIPSTIDLIVIKSTSRIARNLNINSLVEVLIKKGVGLYIEQMNLNTLDMPDISILSYLFGTDAQYSKTLSKTMRKAYREALENRNTIYRNGVYGMEKIGEKKEAILRPINQEYKKLIETIFNLYLEGYGFRRIANWINDNTEFKSTKLDIDGQTYKPLTNSSIKSILHQPKYAGLLAVPIRTDKDKREIGAITRKEGNFYLKKADNIEPCVSEALYNQVQEKIKNNPISIQRRGVKQQYSMFGKVLECSNCHTKFNKTFDSHNKPIYICAERRKHGIEKCNMPILAEDFLLEELNNYVPVYSKTLESRKEFVLNKLDNLKYNIISKYFSTDNKNNIRDLKEEITKLTEQGQNLLITFSNPSLPEATKTFMLETINKLAKDREFKEQELSNLENSKLILKQNIELINLKKTDVKKIKIKDSYTQEEVLKNISKIEVNYKMEEKEINVQGMFLGMGYLKEDIEENRTKRQKRNNCNFDFYSKLDFDMDNLIGMLQNELDLDYLEDFSDSQKAELDKQFVGL